MPVVEDVALCLGEFGLGKTFHAGSRAGIRENDMTRGECA